MKEAGFVALGMVIGVTLIVAFEVSQKKAVGAIVVHLVSRTQEETSNEEVQDTL